MEKFVQFIKYSLRDSCIALAITSLPGLPFSLPFQCFHTEKFNAFFRVSIIQICLDSWYSRIIYRRHCKVTVCLPTLVPSKDLLESRCVNDPLQLILLPNSINDYLRVSSDGSATAGICFIFSPHNFIQFALLFE